MLVIVTEAVPDRLRGYLSRWLLQIRAGVFVGDYSVRVREKLWTVVCREVGTGNAVMAWTARTDAGFDFCTTGPNARNPVEMDGIKLVAWTPEIRETRGNGTGPDADTVADSDAVRDADGDPEGNPERDDGPESGPECGSECGTESGPECGTECGPESGPESCPESGPESGKTRGTKGRAGRRRTQAGDRGP